MAATVTIAVYMLQAPAVVVLALFLVGAGGSAALGVHRVLRHDRGAASKPPTTAPAAKA